MFQSTPLIKRIFWANIFAFIFTLFFSEFTIVNFALWSGDEFRIWQFITHQFLHGGFMHIIFNMLALISIGPSCEEFLGERKFPYFYLICGVGAALLHMAIIDSNVPMVGASGAIFGLLALFSLINPNDKLYLFFIPIGIKAKYMITGLILLEIALGIFSKGDGVGHWAHVGGALTGFLLYFLNRKFFKNIY
jgi:membrane associated rhomboid family serine protease